MLLHNGEWQRLSQEYAAAIIPGAAHTDLYDRTDVIPFDTITEFFRKALK